MSTQQAATKSGEAPKAEKTMRLINVSQRTQGVQVPVKVGRGTTSVKVPPFGMTPEIPESIALGMLEAAPKANALNRKHGYKPADWRAPAEEGDCDGKYTVKGAGDRRHPSCNRRGCKREGHSQAGLHHTVEQAQAMIAKYHTAEGVEGYVQKFDQRPYVIMFAQVVAQHRRETLVKNMGLGSSRPFSPIN